MEPFQDILKEIMDLKGLTQQELADAVGVDQTTVSKWLRGVRKPNYDSILALYQKYGITPNELFGI